MTKELMYGAHAAKLYVSEYLAQDIPTRLIKYRNGWNVDDITLPTPADYLVYEPLALDVWPIVITVAINTKSFNRLEYDGETLDPLYRVTYGMRTYVWVRTEGSEQTTLMRDRLTTVVRSALLDYPCLASAEIDRNVRMEEATLSEEFSELTLLKGDRVLAGAYLSYDLLLDEVITREDLGPPVSQYDIEILGTGNIEQQFPLG